MALNRYIEGKVTWGNVLTLVIMLVSMGVGYVKLIDRVDIIAKELAEHKMMQMQENAAFVRKDVQETRNRFVDEKLDRIERKVDILISR